MLKFHRLWFGIAVSVLIPVMTEPASAAGTLQTLYSFCGLMNCEDGINALGRPVVDSAGSLYGTTNNGGDFESNAGIVYRLVPNGDGTWAFSTIYEFCLDQVCDDGEHAQSGLIMDSAGNLYGTTSGGGAFGAGVAYELMPNGQKTKWKLKVLYDFCSLQSCADGKETYGDLTYAGADTDLPYDGASPLYGIARGGGAAGYGVLYRLSPHRGRWKEKVLHSFCTLTDCADGAYPGSTPVVDATSNVFGTTDTVRTIQGTVYEVSAAGGEWTETVLYTFCQQTGCSDGLEPTSLFLARPGTLLGTTGAGGTGVNCPSSYDGGCGVAFRLTYGNGQPQEKVLYNFCQLADCADGARPISIMRDSLGRIVGTTEFGGGHDIDEYQIGGGTVFQLGRSTEKVLHAFCDRRDCRDGQTPIGGLTSDSAGTLFGVTFKGGANGISNFGNGTVFEFKR